MLVMENANGNFGVNQLKVYGSAVVIIPNRTPIFDDAWLGEEQTTNGIKTDV